MKGNTNKKAAGAQLYAGSRRGFAMGLPAPDKTSAQAKNGFKAGKK